MNRIAIRYAIDCPAIIEAAAAATAVELSKGVFGEKRSGMK